MRALLLLVLSACDMTPNYVSTKNIDGAATSGEWNVVCKGLEMKEDRTREYATERLVRSGAPLAKDCICAHIQGKGGWDKHIANGLQRSRSDAIVGCFAELVAKPDLPDRMEAIAALSMTNAPVATKTLTAIATNTGEEAQLRARAIMSIGGLDASKDILLELLTTDTDPAVRAAAASGLSGMQARPVFKALVQAATEDQEGDVRAAALTAAKKSGASSANTMICEAMMNDSSPAVREAAVGAFQGTGRDSAIACLRKRAFTIEENPAVRDRLLEVLKSSPNDNAALILCDAIPFWMRSYVKDEIPDKLPGTEIVKAQNDRDHKRSYKCLERAYKKSSGYSCYARMHVGLWFRTFGGKTRVPKCPGYERRD